MKGSKRNRAKRVVLAFPPAAVPRPAIDSATQLARLLQATLFGLFVEDADLFAAANLPFLRELDARMRAWRPLSEKGLLEDYAAIAAALRGRLLQSAAELGVEADFAVFRGDPRALVESGTEPSDLLALFEPVTNWALHKTETAASGTVFVPRSARPQEGPVVVIAEEAEAPEVEVASEIAAKAESRVVIVDAAREQSSAFWLRRDQSGAARLVGPPSLATGARHFLQLGLPPASLVVLTRATLERIKESLAAIAAGRSEPWLVLEER